MGKYRNHGLSLLSSEDLGHPTKKAIYKSKSRKSKQVIEDKNNIDYGLGFKCNSRFYSFTYKPPKCKFPQNLSYA
jgi:hypothetical protein